MASLLLYVVLVVALVGGVTLFGRLLGAGRAALSLYLEELGLSAGFGTAVLIVCIVGIGIGWTGSQNLDYGLGVASVLFVVGTTLTGVAMTQRPLYRAAADEDGLVEGPVSPTDGHIETPYTGTACVAYDVRQQTPITGIYTGTTAPLVSERQVATAPFVVEGQTDRVTVHGLDDARVELAVDERSTQDDQQFEERRLQSENTVSVLLVDSDPQLLTEHTMETVRARLTTDVRRNGVVGLGMAVVGAAWLAAYAGLL